MVNLLLEVSRSWGRCVDPALAGLRVGSNSGNSSYEEAFLFCFAGGGVPPDVTVEKLEIIFMGLTLKNKIDENR